VTTSADVLKAAFELTKRSMKANGFSVKGKTLKRTGPDDNTQLIQFQTSQSSTPSSSKVAINYGVYSAHVGKALDEDPSLAFDILNTHYRQRLSGPDERELWIQIDATDNPHAVADTFCSLLEQKVLPDLERHATDESLRTLWRSGSSPGVTELHRGMYLAFLLNASGQDDEMKRVIGEHRAKYQDTIYARVIEALLSGAGIKV